MSWSQQVPPLFPGLRAADRRAFVDRLALRGWRRPGSGECRIFCSIFAIVGREMQQRGWRFGVKRAVDFTVACFGLVSTAPVTLLAAGAIRATMGRPVLFRQTRPGRGGRPFTCYKLRTMKAGEGSDAARLTPLGRLLRSTSLDEIPQLLNVVRGEMSLVGPRPLLMSYLARYSPEQARRHEVLPGMTGWAQINGRNALTHEERFALDVWYVDHWNLTLDVKILLVTLARVIRGSGINAAGHATMPEFQGTLSRSSETSPPANGPSSSPRLSVPFAAVPPPTGVANAG